jgi:hypothetical protein
MKKLAIGCGVVVLLLGVALAGVAYYTYRQARTMFAQFAELGQVPELERSVQNTRTYEPPSTGELTAAQVERLVKVQTAVKKELGDRFTQLEQKYKALSDKKEATITDIPALMAAYRDLTAAWMAAKRSQVAALNDAGLSLAEYKWVREQVYSALGVPFMDFDVSKIVEQVRSGAADIEPGRLLGSLDPSGPESNRKLVAPFKKQLEDNLPLAAFGL